MTFAAAEIELSYEPGRMDLEMIIPVIQASYWGKGRSAAGIRRAFQNSYLAGLFDGPRQVAFARAVSDATYFAYIFDLFVIPDARGQGLGRRMTEAILDHPDLRGVSGWMLASRDAHDLYRKFGFADAPPGRYMAMTR